MSSDVITEPTWNRLHVARRVRDIAKSMMRLSMLGRSIFPIRCLPGPRVEEPANRLKVSEDLADVNRRLPCKTLSDPAMAGANEVGIEVRGGTCRLRGAGRRVPARPPSPRDTRPEGLPRPRGGGYVRGAGPDNVRRGALPEGPRP